MSREQRLVFGEVADLYHRHRPGYPAAVFDEVMAFGQLGRGPRVLEVGAGTGKATAALVGRVLLVTALEPSPEMAAVARNQLRGASGWEAVEQGFEAWDPSGRRFDLLLAAQSWHWVMPEVGYLKAASILRPDGTLALMWNRPQDGPRPGNVGNRPGLPDAGTVVDGWSSRRAAGRPHLRTRELGPLSIREGMPVLMGSGILGAGLSLSAPNSVRPSDVGA